jgi:hypothetical protein
MAANAFLVFVALSTSFLEQLAPMKAQQVLAAGPLHAWEQVRGNVSPMT